MLRSLLRRGEAEEQPPVHQGPHDEILERLIDPDEVIDRFDASYVQDLHEILRELHSVDDTNAREHELWPELRALWELSGRPIEDFSVTRLPQVLIEDVKVDTDRHGPRRAPRAVQRRFSYVKTRSWRKAVGLRLGSTAESAQEQRDVVNAIQREYSEQVNGGRFDLEFEDLSRPETGDPWTPLMTKLREDGVVSPDEPVLAIGPRWIGEIHYFRTVVGLKGTIGLDLFSKDEELIKVGDMHEMPFEDGTFGLVYQRNTFDKSYDIRQALRECVRVLRDGGVLISDDCYAYTDGVSEMARTNIKHNNQVLRVLGDHAGEVLHDAETPSNEDWIDRVGQLAVKVRK